MFETNITSKGFPELLSETYRNPSPSDIIRRFEAIDDAVGMGHSRIRSTVLSFDDDLECFTCETPEGLVLLTHNAHQQLTARQRSAGKNGVIGFTTAITDKGSVALGTGSDKYGYIPFGEVAKRISRLIEDRNMNHTPREMTISPSFVRVLYEVERTEVAGDVLILGWGWQTSHDGSSSLRVFDRVEREICTNGLRATVNDEILRLRHVWGGMLSHHRRELASSSDLALPDRIVRYLATNSRRKMELRATESVLAAIDRQIDSGRFTIQRARDLSELRYWEQDLAWDMTKKILELTMDESKAKLLKDLLGLKQESFKFLKQYSRESWMLQTVKSNLHKYGDSYDYSAWSIVQSLNDKPSFSGRFPVSGMDAMESLSNSVLTNWEQLVQAVTQ